MTNELPLGQNLLRLFLLQQFVGSGLEEVALLGGLTALDVNLHCQFKII